MKIVTIFAERLFAVHYKGEAKNEYDRLMDLWTDVSYLKAYAQKNGRTDIQRFVEKRLEDAEIIEDLLDEIFRGNLPLSMYFRPLENKEELKKLALQKGRIEHNRLRIYAIKIEGCYLITGGAIKMSQKMEEHPDTKRELKKLYEVRAYIKDWGVSDEDTLYELQKENS